MKLHISGMVKRAFRGSLLWNSSFRSVDNSTLSTNPGQQQSCLLALLVDFQGRLAAHSGKQVD